jgi:transcriptional regulator with XRE-family HTH domain
MRYNQFWKEETVTNRGDTPQSLGEYIRRARQQAGLSGRQLAAEVGTNSSNISRIETGATPTPTLELLKRIADVLDIELATLLGYRGMSVQIPGDLDTYLRQHGVPDQGIAEARAAIERIANKYRRTDPSNE